jgi:hypothetical protein
VLLLLPGSFVVADVCDTPTGDKVTGEVVMVLYEGHIRQMRKEARWYDSLAPLLVRHVS